VRIIGNDPTLPVQEIGGDPILTTTESPALIEPNAPGTLPAKKTNRTGAGAMFGFMKPVVFAAMLGAGMTAGAQAQTAGVPLDDGVRIEVPAAPISAVTPVSTPAPTISQLVLDQLARDLESLMRVTARDMADPNTRFIDDAHRYKEPPKNEVKRLVKEALQRIPIGELPGGSALASLIRQLPNTSGLQVEKMSYNELERVLGRSSQKWLEEKFKPLIEGHELEAGLVTFGAMTALRASSNDAARFIDRLSPRVTVWRNDNTRVRLAYRNGEVLPNVDVSAYAAHAYGPVVFRGEIEARLSAENNRHMTGTATAGASWSDHQGHFIDAAATYYDDGQRSVRVLGGYIDRDVVTFGTVTGVFGRGVAVGNASGRVSWEVDYDRRFANGNGSLGAYGGIIMDSDGSNRQFRAGLVFRLTF
jgi:hypothetical protein